MELQDLQGSGHSLLGGLRAQSILSLYLSESSKVVYPEFLSAGRLLDYTTHLKIFCANVPWRQPVLRPSSADLERASDSFRGCSGSS